MGSDGTLKEVSSNREFPVTKKKKQIEAPPAQAKMGRPALDEDVRRTWRISIVVNRGELETITGKAASVGETVSVWGRKRLLEAAEK